MPPTSDQLAAENAELRKRIADLEAELGEAADTLHAIRIGEVDALVVDRGDETDIFSLAAADRFYFQFAQQAAGVGTWDWDLTRGHIYWSEGIYDIFGLDRTKHVPSDELFWRSIHDDDRERLRAKISSLFASNDVEFYDEFQICRPDETCVWVAAKGRVLRDATGAAKRFVGVQIDISDRKRIEDALLESETHFRNLADTMPQMVWTAKANGYTDYFNERWYEFTGYPRDRFGDDSFTPLLHPDDVQRCLDTWYAAVRNGETYTIEYRFWCRDTNTYRWFLGRAAPVRGRDGAIHRWYGTCTDIHDIKSAQEALARSEEALRDADRRKDEFLAMLAHELRNPLAPIQTGLDLLSLEPSPSVEVIHVMREQVSHLVRLVDDLLDVSRIMRGRIELRTEPVELSALLHRVIATTRPWIDGRRQQLEVQLPESPVWLEVDAVRLLQVLANLLNNASKYSEPGERIMVRAGVVHGMAEIAVRDRGVGIEPAFLPYVFELFSQAARSLDRAQGGLGIGLTLVKNLVELHGGRVEARSEGPGRGSEFIVRLPTSSVRGAVVTSEPREAAPPAARRILVVDDNATSTMVVSRLLTKIGEHQVETANDGQTALRKAAEFLPEIVLLDIGLPGMDGFDLARAFRAADYGRTALLVAVTGYGQPEDRRKSADAGFDLHLVKPTSLATLETVLSHPKLCAKPV